MARKSKRFLSLVSVILLALIIALIIFGLSRMPPDGLSQLLARLFQGRDDVPLTPEQQAYETLFAEMAMPETAAPRPLDAISLTEAFSQFAFAEDYNHLYTVRYTDGQQATTRTFSLSRSGSRYTLLVFAGDKVDTTALMQTVRHNGETYIVEDALGNERLYPAGEDFPLASVAMQPDPDTFCALLEAHEANPAASPLSACTAEIANSDLGRMLTLRFTERDSGREEEYHYLLDTGMLFSASSRQGDLVYYEMKTLSYSSEEDVED